MWTANDPIEQRTRSAGRLWYLDHLKVALVGLVVLHHAAQPYGPPDWWYVEGTSRWEPLERFTVVNGSFFMALFFAISAYFLPGSFDRKGGRRYLVDRFRQLGAPLVFGVAVLIPVLMYLHYRVFRDYPPISFGRYYLDIYLGGEDKPSDWTGPTWPDLQFGHLWFIQHLLVAALLYAAWRLLATLVHRPERPEQPQRAPREPRGWAIAGFAVLIGLGTFVLRTRWPVDEWIGILDFIQAEPADLFQYGGLFVAGLLAHRYGWLTGITRRSGYRCLAMGAALAVAHFAALPWLMRFYAPGGTGPRSLVWSLVESTLCVTLCIGLAVLFRERFNRPIRFLGRLAELSFTVYIVHVPVVVGLQLLVRDLDAAPLVKFLTVGTVALPASFVLAAGLRRIPYLRAWL